MCTSKNPFVFSLPSYAKSVKKCQYLILFYLPTRFLINLVAANLLITFVLVPLILIDLIWPSIDSEYLPFYCYILRGMTTLTSSASILGKNSIDYIYYMMLRYIHPTQNYWRIPTGENIWHWNSLRIPMISASLTKFKMEKWKYKKRHSLFLISCFLLLEFGIPVYFCWQK